MNWVWEIPINPKTVSVGYVSSADDFKSIRWQGESVQSAFRRRLARFDRFQELLRTLNDDSVPVHAISFRCRTYRRVCGANWLIVGEAASLPDPITGNGVTAALRHAVEGARLIHKSRRSGRISFWSRVVYNLRVRHMGRFFNSLIEKLAYEWPLRDRIGLLTAGDAYTIPAWSINHIYSRVRPHGMVSTLMFCGFLTVLRGATWCVYQFCRVFPASEAWAKGAVTCT
jgi:flavin-dependent dehydrogenase